MPDFTAATTITTTVATDAAHYAARVAQQQWERFATSVRNYALRALNEPKPLLRVTPPDGATWYELYLANLPTTLRASHTCQTCRDFINTYGGLVQIDDAGRQVAILWDGDLRGNWTGTYGAAQMALAKACFAGTLTDVFYTSAATWGTPTTTRADGTSYTHLALTPPSDRVYQHPLMTAAAAMTAKRAAVLRTIARLKVLTNTALLDQLYALLRSTTLPAGPALYQQLNWLARLSYAITPAHTHLKQRRVARIWDAVASAPPEYSAANSPLDGLIASLARGDSPAATLAAFAQTAAAADPAPTGALTNRSMRRAAYLVRRAGLTSALQRRFATRAEVPCVWQRHYILGHVEQSLLTRMNGSTRGTRYPPNTMMTWTRFAAEVLPDALRLRYYCPTSAVFCALVGPVDPASLPLFKWDTAAQRNPYNWYSYVNGSRAKRWGLNEGHLYDIEAVILRPSLWYPAAYAESAGEPGVLFHITSCYDTQPKSSALFSETLRGDLSPEVVTYITLFSHDHPLVPVANGNQCVAGPRFIGGTDRLTLSVSTIDSIQEITLVNW